MTIYCCGECSREYELPEYRKVKRPGQTGDVYEAAGPYFCGEHLPVVALRKVDPQQKEEAAICAKRGHQAAASGLYTQIMTATCKWCGAKYKPYGGLQQIGGQRG